METTPLKIETYTAILDCTGTNAPVATVMHNTMSGTPPVWSRLGTGQYWADKIELEPTNSVIFVTNTPQQALLTAYPDSEGVVIEAFDITQSPQDGLERVCVEIRKYNNL